MGQINILLESNEDRIKDLFKELRQTCISFYHDYFNPLHEDIDAMQIRGRLDFVGRNSTEEANIRTAMTQQVESIKKNELSSVYIESKDTLLGRSGKDALAYIQIAMYGQMTTINQDLWSDVLQTIYKNISTFELTAVYESFSAFERGSKNYVPFELLIESGAEGMILERSIPEESVNMNVRLNKKRNGIPPKDNIDEYFALGRNPKVI